MPRVATSVAQEVVATLDEESISAMRLEAEELAKGFPEGTNPAETGEMARGLRVEIWWSGDETFYRMADLWAHFTVMVSIKCSTTTGTANS